MKRGKGFVLPAASGRVLGSLLLLLWSIQTAEAMVVWTDHATVKIRREISLTAPKTNQTSAVLKAAKNEFEAFQLIVSADLGNLSGVDVTVSDLTGPNGTVPGSTIMIYKEAFINITALSTTEGRLGNWPDALIPKRDEYTGQVRNAFPFSVTSGRNQPVWIEIYVPQTAAAGVYTGTATVTATNQAPVFVPIELTVWNFVLPSTSTLKSAYSIDYHLIPIGHGLGSAYMNQLDLIKTYGKANLLHRITGDYLPGPHVVTGGWDAFTTRFGPLINGTERLPGGKLPGAKMTSYRMSIWGQETNVTFLRDLAQRAAARGWIDRLFAYTFDEPKLNQPAQWQTIKDRARALHQADPRLRSLVTTSIQSAEDFGITQCGSPRVEPCLDIFTPTIRYMDNKATGREPGSEVPGGAETVGNQRSKYGPAVWWYQACGSHGCGIVGGGDTYDPEGYHTGWPAYIIDLPAMFSRVMQWQTFKYNVQGELYYDMVYAYGQRDPWVSQYDFAGNGDGTLYYPGTPAKIGGTTHIPIESIRLKLLREGMEDYEYMNLLAKLGDGDYAERQVATVVTRTYDWSRNPADLYQARENMARQILSHDGSGEPTPGTASFRLNYTPASATVTAGGTASSSITLSSLFDFNAAVALTCSTSHPTVTCTVNPASVTPPANGNGTATLNMVTQSATPNGTYSVAVRSVSGSLIKEGTLTLTVAAATPVGESFDRADSTNLGSGWNEYLADFGIRGNEVSNLDAASQEAQWLASLGPNQEVSADCRVSAAGNSCGVMARWVDAGNFYYLRLDPGLGNIALIKKVNGVYTNLATANRTMAFNAFYRLRLVVSGNTLTAYFAGETTPAITVTDTSLAGNFSGIRSYATAAGNTRVDRFNAVSLAGAWIESFNRANNTSLGSNWNEYLLNFEINTNQLRNSDTAGQEAQWTPMIGANQDVSADCKVTVSGNSCGVIARWSNANNFYYALVDPGLGSVALIKRVNGVFTRLAIASRPMSYNAFYQIRLVTQGSSLRVFFNGESTAVINLNDASLAGGNYAGIRSYATAASTTYFDNFRAGLP